MNKPKIPLEDRRRLLLAGIVALGVILVGYGVLRAATGFRLPDRIDRNLPNVIIFAAFMIFLYGRRLAKQESAALKDEDEAAASPEAGSDAAGADDEGGDGRLG